MAQLNNDELDLTGKLGNLSIYKRGKSKKRIVRVRKGPSAKDIRTKPNYASTRKNNLEFSYAVKTGKIIRKQLEGLYSRIIDYNFHNRLNSRLRLLMTHDKTVEVGCRRLTREVLAQFGKVSLNELAENNLVLSDISFLGENHYAISMSPDLAAINKYFTAMTEVVAPTHFQIINTLFENSLGSFKKLACNESSLGCISSHAPKRIFLEQRFLKDNKKVYFQVTGIVFYREVNGGYITVEDKSLNAGWMELISDAKTDLKKTLPLSSTSSCLICQPVSPALEGFWVTGHKIAHP